MKPKLSIIIPSLNETYYLPRVLQSIKKQKFEDKEVIVVNAGKYKVIRKIGKKFKAKVVDCSVDPHGPAYARNVGAKAARGEILLFLDADVIMPENFLKNSIEEFEKRYLGVAGVYARPHSDKIFDEMFWQFYNFIIFMMKILRPEASGFCLFCRKDIHDQINGFDREITYREDADYTTRAAKYARYGVLKMPILISVRRFRKEGRARMLLKYIVLSAKGLFHKIREDVGYTFGEYTGKIRRRVKKHAKRFYKSSMDVSKKVYKKSADVAIKIARA